MPEGCVVAAHRQLPLRLFRAVRPDAQHASPVVLDCDRSDVVVVLQALREVALLFHCQVSFDGDVSHPAIADGEQEGGAGGSFHAYFLALAHRASTRRSSVGVQGTKGALERKIGTMHMSISLSTCALR